jgi:hypothetical protein
MTSPHAQKSAKKTSFLRVLLLITLTLTGLATGGISYYFIRSSQALFAESQFFGKINDHFKSSKKAFNLLLQANLAITTALASACPSASDWPNCKVSSADVVSRTTPLSAMSGVLVFTVSPIIRPEDRESFEDFAAAYYARDGGYPEGTGNSGIYDYDGVTKIRSPNHTDPATHRRDILVPLLYSSILSYNFYLSNAYADSFLKPTLDEILDCVDSPSSSNSCSTISNFISTGTHSAVASPVIPINDPNTVVGFAGASFSWETLFSTAVQHEFDFQCSVQSDSSPTVLTFTIKNGVAHTTTGISHPSPSFDGFWKQSKKSFILNPDDILVNESKYTVTYYSTNTPPSPVFAVVAGLCCVGITFIISMIFVVFNTLMSQAALEASMLLDTKRTYVRFVSHEIRSSSSSPPFSCRRLTTSTALLSDRTPLNTISLSIRILLENLNELRDFHLHDLESERGSELGVTKDPKKMLRISLLFDECLGLIDDLDENSSVAVTTLNDLINYDKIETNTFAIEEKDVNIWSVIEKTVGPLTLQAKEKNIELSLVTRVADDDVNLDVNSLRVVGDSIKLGQVIRNLVSNALKFTPPHGEVKISGLTLLSALPLSRVLIFFLLSLLPTNRNCCSHSSSSKWDIIRDDQR